MKVYGIKSCDTVQKAVKWLTKHKVNFEFIDFKTQPVSEAKLKNWSTQRGWENVLNKKSTTWRELGEGQAAITTQQKAVSFMKANQSSIKRPVLELDEQVIIQGFDENKYKELFLK